MPCDVVLVQPPFAPVDSPSLALSTLQAALLDAGIDTRVVYANLAFAERIGLARYHLIDTRAWYEPGEWCFSPAAFPDFEANAFGYLRRLASGRVEEYPQDGLELQHWVEALSVARRRARAFVDELAPEVLALEPKVVACSSSYQQHCASLALLRALRGQAPHVIRVIGGANCDGSMGEVTHQCFDWIDFTVCGDADALIVELMTRALDAGRDVTAEALPRGVYGPGHRVTPGARRGAPTEPARHALTFDLDALPMPRFDDYFDALARSPLADALRETLPLETTRGCSYGERHHCTFCGINGPGMPFRSKSCERVAEELSTLPARHGVEHVFLVNAMLEPRQLAGALPLLETRPGALDIFCETLVGLSHSDLETLVAAGVREIQPGLESMHDETLRRLDKGNSAAANVRLLRRAAEHGLRVTWNLLYGIPGVDGPRSYREMASWLDEIAHLQPPTLSAVRVTRFSPYHARPQQYGIAIEPSQCYRYIFPLHGDDLSRFARYFEVEPAEPADLDALDALGELRTRVHDWNARWRSDGASPPKLAATDEHCRQIVDTRPCAVAAEHALDEVEAALLRACESGLRPQRAVAAASASAARELTAAQVDHAAERLLERKLMRALSQQWVSLVCLPRVRVRSAAAAR